LKTQVKYFDFYLEEKNLVENEEFEYDENKFDPMVEVVYWK
jgi:hypothetical protein